MSCWVAVDVTPIPLGWSELEPAVDPDGMTAVAFKSDLTQQIVVSYRGSVTLHDWGVADTELAGGIRPDQFNAAEQFAQKIERENSGYTLFVTGHSLGGAEAEDVASTLNLGGVTFAAPGVSSLISTAPIPADPALTDYVIAADPVGNYTGLAGCHVGSVVTLPTVTYLSNILFGGLLGLLTPGGPAAAYVGLAAATSHLLSSYGQALLDAGRIPFDPLSGSIFAFGDLASIYHNILNAYAGTTVQTAIDNSGDTLTVNGDGTGTFSDTSGGTLSDVAVPAGLTFAVPPTGPFTVSGSVTNAGILQVVSGGTINVIGGTITGGTISADKGGTVSVGSDGIFDAVVLAGDGTGTFQGTGGDIDYYYDRHGGILQDVSLQAGETFTATGDTELRGTIVNSGTLGGVFAADGTVVLTGGGQASGQFSSAAYVRFANRSTSAAELINVDNTLAGSGGTYGNDLTLVNQSGGLIDADLPGQAFSLNAATVNQGLVEASNGGLMGIGGTFDNAGGTLVAMSGGLVQVVAGGIIEGGPPVRANGGTVAFAGGSMIGGTVAAINGGTVSVGQDGTLDGVVLTGDGTAPYQGTNSDDPYYSYFMGAGALQGVKISTGVAYTALSHNITVLRGTIANGGTLAAASGGYFAIDGPVTLTGGGALQLGGGALNGAAAFGSDGLHLSADPDLLINADNTIGGFGQVSSDLTNRSGGVIDANLSYQKLYLGGAVNNQGLVKANNGGILDITGTFDNDGGMIEALSGGVVTATAIRNGSVFAIFGGTIVVSDSLVVGDESLGHLLVESQGTVETGGNAGTDPIQGLDLALVAGTAGKATVTGSKSLLTNTGRFIVGDAGTGILSIQSGGTVITTPGPVAGIPGADIAAQTGSDGSHASVVGAGSNWQITGQLLVGNAAAGSLGIAAGGTVTAGQVDAGVLAGSTGIISVVGTGSSLELTGQLTIGDAASAELFILNGATVSANNGDIGVQAGSTGNVDIEDTGSRLNIANDLNIGEAGVGVLTLGNNTELTVTNNLNIGANGVLNQFGGIIDPSVVNNTGRAGGKGAITATVSIVNTGTLFAASGTETLVAPVITGTGVLEIDTGGNLTVNAGSVAATQTVTFTDGTGILTIGTLGGFGATIGDFIAGDAIIVQGTSIASDSFDASTHVLTLFDASSATIGTLQFGSSVTGANLGVNGTGWIGAAPCFVAGTRIGTERGEVAVEDLRVGDRVQVVLGAHTPSLPGPHPNPPPLRGRGGSTPTPPLPRSGGGLGWGLGVAQPVVWIGHRTVDCSRHPEPRKVWPVRISAGAFGPGRPCRDLFLSPDHAVYVADVLIPVKHLINATRSRRCRATQ
jgi:T5SS/PEP-CTERM-associated repeat protein